VNPSPLLKKEMRGNWEIPQTGSGKTGISGKFLGGPGRGNRFDFWEPGLGRLGLSFLVKAMDSCRRPSTPSKRGLKKKKKPGILTDRPSKKGVKLSFGG